MSYSGVCDRNECFLTSGSSMMLSCLVFAPVLNGSLCDGLTHVPCTDFWLCNIPKNLCIGLLLTHTRMVAEALPNPLGTWSIFTWLPLPSTAQCLEWHPWTDWLFFMSESAREDGLFSAFFFLLSYCKDDEKVKTWLLKLDLQNKADEEMCYFLSASRNKTNTQLLHISRERQAKLVFKCELKHFFAQLLPL